MNVLIGLVPQGLGTAHTESLSSWTRRISAAEVRPVSDLLRDFVLEPIRLERSQRHHMLQPTRVTEAINGSGASAATLVQRLTVLTGVSSIRAMTLIDRDTAIEFREAFRTERAWCPACLEEDGEAPYDRLVWSFTAAVACVRHRVALVSRCPRCGKRHRPWHRNASPHRCPWCWTPLTQGDRLGVGDSVSTALVELVFELLSDRIQKGAVSAAFASLVAARGGLRPAAHDLGAAPSELALIGSGRVRPHFDLVVRASIVAGADVPTFLGPHPVAVVARARACVRRSRPPAPEPRLAHRLEVAMFEVPPPSLRRLAERLQTTPARLRALFPTLTRRAVERRRRWVTAAAVARRLVLEERVRSAALQAGAGSSRRIVERLLGSGGVFRSRYARKSLREATGPPVAPAA